MRIPIYYVKSCDTTVEPSQVSALIDSGAGGIFMNEQFA